MFRPAQESDLAQVYEVFYQTEILDHPHPPARGDVPGYLRHVLQTGTLVVAEQEQAIVGYAGAITRGPISFLTDLFVHPSHQSSQLGKALLQAALPPDHLTLRCTVSSSDPRAQALYIRAGMVPQWPSFALRLEDPARAWPTPADIEISEAAPDDPALLEWDAQISGRPRPLEHRYWVRKEQAVPLWFQRQQQRVGYGYIRLNAGTLWQPNAYAVGPLGVRSAEDATACALAALRWAAQRSAVVHITVPGPHPALAPLLEHGFHIAYADIFMSSAKTPFFDALCYLPSGGDLF